MSVIGVERILAAAGLKPAEVDRFVHGSTVAINALIQRKGAVTGLLATDGFEDTLEIGRHKRSRMYELFLGRKRRRSSRRGAAVAASPNASRPTARLSRRSMKLQCGPRSSGFSKKA